MFDNLQAKFILDPHPQDKQKMYFTATHMIASGIRFLFSLPMRVEYELGFNFYFVHLLAKPNASNLGLIRNPIAKGSG